MSQPNYQIIQSDTGRPIKAWVNGVLLEDQARNQLLNVAQMPFIYQWVAAMPDVHWGMGATVGSVIPTVGAIIPAAVGVDIGCGMMAVQTTLKASDLPDNLKEIRTNIEKAVPHGRTQNGRPGDRGAWGDPPKEELQAWAELEPGFTRIKEKHPKIRSGLNKNNLHHLGTLGTGNHFIEICLDETDTVWFMLHSGSRGVGNNIGTYFIELAKQDMGKRVSNLPDTDLAYFSEGADHFNDYVEAVSWAQQFAMVNRELMMRAVIRAVRASKGIPEFNTDLKAVNCHHNYVSRETHYGKEVLITRKGAVRAGKDDLGIIPGSMGAQSYIVRGLGNEESFHSCSHGDGRMMSRNEAKRRFSLADHIQATQGVECRKDPEVIDETPAAYKPIDAVMNAQKDLVEVLHTLKQVVCVKG